MLKQAVAKNVSQPGQIAGKTIPEDIEEAILEVRRSENIITLTDAVREAYTEWQSALSNFENAECKDMIDYYTYRIKASQIRYEYLLRKVKQAEVQ